MKDQLIQYLAPGNISPLIFTQFGFWIFFGFVLLIFSFVYRRIQLRNTFLFIAGLFFFYKAGGLFILVFITLLICNFFLIQAMDRMLQKHQRKGILLLTLVINLGLLIGFKYSDFIFSLFGGSYGFTSTASGIQNHYSGIQGPSASITDYIIPVGISFFTFQLISYGLEVYRKKISPLKNFFDFGFYISFFPNLISGPLVTPQKFLPQIREPYNLTKEEFGSACFLILSGLIKKMVFADYLSINLVSRVFENPHLFTGFENLVAVYGYALQIYFDFSGYTDIAIGVALLLGFRLPQNFNSPYKARNITEFWKRWHMSLTNWFLNYLFLPLVYWLSGRMEKKKYFMIKTEKWIYLTGIMVTFLLCGLWHGASMTFVLWGGIHGIALISHKIFFPKTSTKKNIPSLKFYFSVFLTFHFIVLTWVIFRGTSMETIFSMAERILFRFHPELIPEMVAAYWKILLLMIIGFTIIWTPEKIFFSIRDRFISFSDPVKGFIILFIIIFVYQFKVSAIQPFIYFQF